MASISEKSLTVQGKSVPSAYPEPPKEKRRSRQIVDRAHAKFALEAFYAADPKPRRFVLFLCNSFVFAAKLINVFVIGFLTIAMVGFVVNNDNVL